MSQSDIDWIIELVKKGSCCRLAGVISVSQLSRAKDPIWDFSKDAIQRARSIDPTRVRIDWGQWGLSPRIVQELQTIFLFYAKVPAWYGGKKNLKPQSIVPRAKEACRILAKVLSDADIYDLDISLADVTLIDLEKSLSDYTGNKATLGATLNVVFSAASGRLIGRDMNVDAKTDMRLKKALASSPNDSPLEEATRWLSDAQFAEASYSSLARVKDFLTRMNLPTLNETNYEYEPPKGLRGVQDFRNLFGIYVDYKNSGSNGVRDRDSERSLRDMGISIAELTSYLKDVNMASQCVIGLYTGGRFSELASLECGCRSKKDGFDVVVGHVFKTKSSHDISDDTWVAIDVVLDAVESLEALSAIKGSSYLFSPNNLISGAERDDGVEGRKAYSYAGFHVAMKQYFAGLSKSLFEDWTFNSHQFKHSLTRQMIKAHLGMPYISFQLKHMYDQVRNIPSEVTIAYGNSVSLLQSKMAGYFLSEFKREKVVQIFSPDSELSGGGAKEFTARKKIYFEGMTSAGYSDEEIIEGLGRLTDAVFVNVGLGYCTGRKSDPEGAKDLPCIGQLRCNPNKCKNAAITSEHVPAWEASRADNVRMLNDPRFSYGKEQYLLAIAEADEVISKFKGNK
jgi:hypothetical protein